MIKVRNINHSLIACPDLRELVPGAKGALKLYLLFIAKVKGVHGCSRGSKSPDCVFCKILVLTTSIISV